MKDEIIKALAQFALEHGMTTPSEYAEEWFSKTYEKNIKESEIPKSITLFSNGTAMVFDEKDEQMGELQVNVDNFYFEFLELKGIDPTKISEIRKIVNGSKRLLIPFKKEDGGWNSNFIEKD